MSVLLPLSGCKILCTAQGHFDDSCWASRARYSLIFPAEISTAGPQGWLTLLLWSWAYSTAVFWKQYFNHVSFIFISLNQSQSLGTILFCSSETVYCLWSPLISSPTIFSISCTVWKQDFLCNISTPVHDMQKYTTSLSCYMQMRLPSAGEITRRQLIYGPQCSGKMYTCAPPYVWRWRLIQRLKSTKCTLLTSTSFTSSRWRSLDV